MADRTGIEWTDASWNPLRGCTRVSEGCRFCYAEVIAARFSKPGQAYHGVADATRTGSKWTGRVDLVAHLLDQPLRWRRPRRIFVNSMSDLFHAAVPDDWIDQIFGVMALAPQHTFQVLTKRPERMLQWMAKPRPHSAVVECVSAAYVDNPHLAKKWPFDQRRAIEIGQTSWPPPNVWLGVSVENQANADTRIPLLLRTHGVRRFLSCEPLLGRVEIEPWLAAGGIGWVIAGGESGCHARPPNPVWFRSLRDQCATFDVPFFFKQWGEWVSVSEVEGPGEHYIFADGRTVRWVGKRRAGRTLDGMVHQDFPA